MLCEEAGIGKRKICTLCARYKALPVIRLLSSTGCTDLAQQNAGDVTMRVQRGVAVALRLTDVATTPVSWLGVGWCRANIHQTMNSQMLQKFHGSRL